MRIGIVIDDLDRRRGGMSEWCWRFVDAAVKRGLDLHVIAQGFGAELLPPQVPRHRIARPRSRLEFARAASNAVRSWRLHVGHDMGWAGNAISFSRTAARMPRGSVGG